MHEPTHAPAEADIPAEPPAADDPFWDGTDGAHPAYWRGTDSGVHAAVSIWKDTLAGKQPAGCVSHRDLQDCRERTAALVAARSASPDEAITTFERMLAHAWRTARAATDRLARLEDTILNARRYERLRVLGCAPATSPNLAAATVLVATNLDAFVDDDMARQPTRGEAKDAAS